MMGHIAEICGSFPAFSRFLCGSRLPRAESDYRHRTDSGEVTLPHNLFMVFIGDFLPEGWLLFTISLCGSLQH